MIMTESEKISNTAFELIAAVSDIWKLNSKSFIVSQSPQVHVTSMKESKVFDFVEVMAENTAVASSSRI